MTNKEYTLKYLFEHEDLLLQIIDCAVCRAVGLDKYCRDTQSISCEDTKKEWLSMERNPLNLKVGDIVEIELNPYNTELRYYIGSELNLMYFAKTKTEYELAKKHGMVNYPNKTTNALVKNCKHFPCSSCMFCDKPNSCNVERENWLNAEHEETLFPVGTVVEVPAPYDSDTTELRYYWGVYHGLHYACKLKSSLGQTLTNGHPICEFYDPATIRKVGD